MTKWDALLCPNIHKILEKIRLRQLLAYLLVLVDCSLKSIACIVLNMLLILQMQEMGLNQYPLCKCNGSRI